MKKAIVFLVVAAIALAYNIISLMLNVNDVNDVFIIVGAIAFCSTVFLIVSGLQFYREQHKEHID